MGLIIVSNCLGLRDKMRYSHKKRRLLTGFASLSFFIAASLCFGYALQGQDRNGILGLHINEDAQSLLDYLPFFNAKAESVSAYPSGDVQNQVILVNLKQSENDPTWINDAKITQANELLNGEQASLKKYINDISYGNVNAISTLYGQSKDGYAPSHLLDYYITEADGKTETMLEEELLIEMIAKFDQDGIDGSIEKKTKEELDTNHDGYVDNITFVIRGNKHDEHNLLWPHQYSMNAEQSDKNYPTITCANGETLKVKDYNVIISGDGEEPDGRKSGIFHPTSTDLGVICHEYLHVYGFPDMYHNYKYDEATGKFVPLNDDEQKGDPLGNWDIMDNTISQYPQNPLYYTNKAYSPWKQLIPEPMKINENTQQVTLHKVAYGTSETMAAIIEVDPALNPLAEKEYFMIEYRKTDGWDQGLGNPAYGVNVSSGLLVYRINEAANYDSDVKAIRDFCNGNDVNGGNYCGNMFGPPDEVYIFRPNVTSIEPASGSTDENLRNATLSSSSSWGSSLGRSFEQVEGYVPSELKDTIYFSDGTNSGIVISNVSDAGGDTITFDVTLPEPLEDHKAPVIDEAVSGNGVDGKWTNENPTLTLHVSDQGKGLAQIQVTTQDGEIVGGEAPINYTKTYAAGDQITQTAFTFTVAKNGTYEVIAIDHAGNKSIPKKIVVENIDTTIPEIQVDKAQKNATATKLPVSFTDTGSGILPGSAFYQTVGIKDATTDLNYQSPVENEVITLDSNFQGKVCITVKDRAGNSAKNPSCWVISDDKKAPVIQVDSDDHEHTWSGDRRTITVNASDQDELDTGISYIEVTTSDGHIDAENERHLIKDYGTAGQTKEQYSFYVTSNGTYEIKVCDYASQCSTSKIVITNIDRSAPVISSIVVKNKNELGLFPTSAHVISFVAHDEPVSANSGVKEIKYQLVSTNDVYESDITSAKWISISPDQSIETDEDFVGTIYAYAIDQAGNISKIFQKEIERISTSLTNNAMREGISDPTGSVAIIGLNDPEVSVTLRDVDLKSYEASLPEAFLASHELQQVYDISLMKLGLPYTLSDSVKVRLAVDPTLLENGSLKLITIGEDGTPITISTTVGDGYLEFETDKLSVYATVIDQIEATDTPETLVNRSGPETGDHTVLIYYIFGILLSIGGMTILVWYRKQDPWMK